MTLERFMEKVEKVDSGCWLWRGYIMPKGYGQCSGYGRSTRAHRVIYELVKGLIPAGLQLDHLCRVRSCVNPDHLEIVTAKENVLRGIGVTAQRARQRLCHKGHALEADGQRRICRECNKRRSRESKARRRADGRLK